MSDLERLDDNALSQVAGGSSEQTYTFSWPSVYQVPNTNKFHSIYNGNYVKVSADTRIRTTLYTLEADGMYHRKNQKDRDFPTAEELAGYVFVSYELEPWLIVNQ